jgi:hypothetical protein
MSCVRLCTRERRAYSWRLDCGNIFNPETGFESLFGQCDLPCVGNQQEACGGFNGPAAPLMNLFQKDAGICSNFPPQGVLLTSGPWRFSGFYKYAKQTYLKQ